MVDAITNALNLETNAGVINLVSSQKITIASLVQKIIALSGKNIIPEIISTTTPNRDYIFDNSKMRDILISKETGLEEGLLEEWTYVKSLQG